MHPLILMDLVPRVSLHRTKRGQTWWYLQAGWSWGVGDNWVGLAIRWKLSKSWWLQQKPWTRDQSHTHTRSLSPTGQSAIWDSATKTLWPHSHQGSPLDLALLAFGKWATSSILLQEQRANTKVTAPVWWHKHSSSERTHTELAIACLWWGTGPEGI